MLHNVLYCAESRFVSQCIDTWIYYEHNLDRRTSNCSDSEESGDEESADQSPSAADGVVESDTSTDRITTPPDELIARELAESPNAKKKKSSEGKKISLQEMTKCIRMTPAAKRREDMVDKMLALYQKEQSRSQEEVEDEYVMSFLSMVKRVNTLLNKHQKERVLQEVEEVVRREINKALDAEETGNAAAGDAPRNMPPPPPVIPMPMASTSTSDLQNFVGLQAHSPPPLQCMDQYYNQGQITFDPQTGQQLYRM